MKAKGKRTLNNGPYYSNEEVYGPDNELMFNCSREKADWYLSQGLAEIISNGTRRRIKLLFQPKGPGNRGEEYELSEKHSNCVVCGKESDLTRHHVIPECFRKHMPLTIKDKNMYDVLLVCLKCHLKYEGQAHLLKKKLFAADEKIMLHMEKAKHFECACKLARVFAKYYEKVPPVRMLELKQRFIHLTGFEYYPGADVKLENDFKNMKTAGQMMVEKLEDYEEFIIMWRKHFVDTMKPNFLSPHWKYDRKLRAERKNGVW